MKKKLTTKLNAKNKIKTGKGVLRVSTDMQALTQHGSLDAQFQRITRWCETRCASSGLQYQVKDWVKEEQSAFRDKNFKRKKMMQLMVDMENGTIDFIAFESVSRLFRAVDFASKFLRLAEENGIEVWEIESGMNYADASNPYLYQMFIAKAAASEAESLISSYRVTTKHREAMVNHGKDPSPRASFLGLDLHPQKVGFYIVNKTDLEIVIDIMRAFVQFKNYPETEEYCREKGYKNKIFYIKQKVDRDGFIVQPKKQGGEFFNQASLRSLFENERYSGRGHFFDKINQFPKMQDECGFVAWEYAHGQVIDQLLLDQVDETLLVAGFKKRPRKMATKDFSLLGGLIVDSQGQAFHCQSAKDHQYRYYFNPSNGFRVSMDKLDKLFIKLLDSYKNESSAVMNVLDDYVGKLKKEVASYGQRVMEITGKIEACKQDLDQLSLKKRHSLIHGSKDEVILSFEKEIKKTEQLLVELNDEKVLLNGKKEAALMSCNPDYIKKGFNGIIEEIKSTKGNKQRLLIKSLVKRITVESDCSAKVVFNSSYLISPRMAELGGDKVAGKKKWWDQ